MKKQFLVLFLTLFVQFTKAQTLLLTDLITLVKSETFTIFNDQLVEKGFSFIDNPDSLSYRFISDKKILSTSKEGREFLDHNEISYIIPHGNIKGTCIIYATESKQEYISFLKQFKKEGFKDYQSFIKEDGSKGIATRYESVKFNNIYIELQIFNRILENSSESITTNSYAFYIINYKD